MHSIHSTEGRTKRFSLRYVLGLTTIVAAASAVTAYTGSSEVGIHLSCLIVGGLLLRFSPVHPIPVVLILLGGNILLFTTLHWLRGAEDNWGSREIRNLLASVMITFGLSVHIWRGTSVQHAWSRQQRTRQIAGAALIMAILFGWWISIPALGTAATVRRRAADVATIAAAEKHAVATIEALRARLKHSERN